VRTSNLAQQSEKLNYIECVWIKVDQLDDTCFIMSIYCSKMFRMLIHPSSGACDYLVCYCVGCIVLTWGVLVLCSGSACTRIPHHQQPIPLHNTNTPQISLHNNAPSSRKLLKMVVLTSEICWAVNWHNKASVIKLVYLYSNIKMMHGPIRIRYIDCGLLPTLFLKIRLYSFKWFYDSEQ